LSLVRLPVTWTLQLNHETQPLLLIFYFTETLLFMFKHIYVDSVFHELQCLLSLVRLLALFLIDNYET
jgi:hypothetical protein